MTLRRSAFDHYRVFLGSSATPSNVFCYAGQELVGQLCFLDRPAAELPGAVSKADGSTWLPYPTPLLGPVLELLRNESPLYLIFDEAQGAGYLSTGDEPAGEAELAALRQA